MTHVRSSVRSLAVLAVAALAVGTPGGSSLSAQDRQVLIQTGTVIGTPQNNVPMGAVEQNGTGLIVGQVVDADGATPIAGAVVAIGGASGGFVPVQVVNGPAGGIVAGTPQQTPRVLSDGEGRFAFRNLPKGSYNFTAQKAGYSDGAYGRMRPGGATQTLDLDDGERRGDVKIRMFKFAAITGTIVDESNEPVVGATVRAYRRNLVAGRRVLAPVGQSVQTDDRGTYRLGGLTPGEYLIAAPNVQTSMPASFQMQGQIPPDLISTLSSPGGGFSISTGGSPVTPDGRFLLQNSGRTVTPASAGGRWMVYATQYYPSAMTTEQAVPIVVKSGEERSGVDMQLRLVAAVNISGKLVGPDGPAVNWGLHLVPGDTSDLSSDPDVATSVTDADGAFMFLAVPSGQYVIQTVRVPRPAPTPGAGTTILQNGGGGTMVFTTTVNTPTSNNATPAPPPPPPDPTLWVSAPVAPGAEDVSDLTLSLRTGFTVTGHLEFQGAATPPTASRLTQIPIIVEPADGKIKANTTPGRVDTQGNFIVYGLLPGRYLVRAAGAPSGWTFKAAMLGGTDVSETPVSVEDRDVAGIVVTFNDAPTDLRGTVRASDGTADDSSSVVVFPSDDRSWMDYGINPRRVRLTRTSKTGTYAFGALPPGDYYLVAFSDEFAGEWQDPAFLEQLSRAAMRVTLNEGDKRQQDLTRQTIHPGGGLVPILFDVDAPSVGGPHVADDDARQTQQTQQGPPRDVKPTPTPTPQPVRDAPALATTGTSVVSGTVVLDDGSLQPVRHARVTLRSTDSRGERMATTDDTGRFVIPSVPAGHYTVIAQKAAYVPVYYGSKHPGRGPGTALTVGDGQMISDLSVRLPRGGVITGRVFDDFGSPVSNASVRVLQYRSVGGEQVLQAAVVPGGASAFVQTDDRGVYRVWGLIPGSYVVSVTPTNLVGAGGELRQLSTTEMQAALAAVQQSGGLRMSPSTAGASGVSPHPASVADTPTPPPVMPPAGRAVGYAMVYYPGTWSSVDAQTVTVSAGQELTGIDVPLHLLPTARVSGTVLGPDGQPVPSVRLNLVPMSQIQQGFFALSPIRSTPDGQFSGQNVAPGHYLLTAQGGGGGPVFFPPSAPPPPPAPTAGVIPGRPVPTGGTAPLWAQQELDVTGEDITGITLTLQEGMTLSGRIVFDGKALAPPADLTRMTVALTPANPRGIVIGVPPAQVDADGNFQLTGVTPGRYRVTSNVPGSSPGNGWQLRSSVIEGHDTLDDPIEIRPGQNVAGAVLTFSDQIAEISGTLVDAAGKPAPGFTILVFSTNRAYWTSGSRRMPQPVQPSSDGKFRAAGLPAGEYYLAAVTDLDPQDWGDPAFMEQVAAAAIKITLADGEKKVQDLKIAQ